MEPRPEIRALHRDVLAGTKTKWITELCLLNAAGKRTTGWIALADRTAGVAMTALALAAAALSGKLCVSAMHAPTAKICRPLFITSPVAKN